MKVLILILNLFLITNIFAQECGNTNSKNTEKDLRAEGQSMYGMPILDQGTQQYCYSYSGSMLLSAWINSQHKNLSIEERQKFVISPAVSAVATEATADTKICGKQHPCDVIDLATTVGACGAKNAFTTVDGVKMQIDGFHALNPQEYNCYPNLKDIKLESFYQEVSDVLYKKSEKDILNNTKEYRDNVTEYFRDRVLTTFPSLTPGKQKRITELLLARANTKKVLQYIPIIASWAPQCISFDEKQYPGKAIRLPGKNKGEIFQGDLRFDGDNAIATKPRCEYKTSNAASFGAGCNRIQSNYKKTDYLKFLNNHFDRKNPQPVGISYCEQFLFLGLSTPEKKSTDGACIIYDKNGNVRKGIEGIDHKSLLIGRRVNKKTGQCEFLLRNSAGNECDQYSGENKSGLQSLRDRCKEEKAKSGYADLWVPADYLTGQMHGVTTLE